MLLRLTSMLPIAILLALSLFWLMAKLIEPSVQQETISNSVFSVDFLKSLPNEPLDTIKPEESLVIEEDIPLESPVFEAPTLNLANFNSVNFSAESPSIKVPFNPSKLVIELPSALSGLALEQSEHKLGEVNTNPGLVALRENTLTYPDKARRQRIEGWVKFNYLVNTQGNVEKVEIVESNPPRVFDRVVMKEVYRWKYKPRIVEGQALETQVVDRKYVFQL